VVADRRKKRRRVNVQFVQEDIRKRMRKTHPDVPTRVIRNVFNALLRAQVFIHRDGTPARTSLAPFTLEKDASEMNLALTNVYLEILHEEGADLSDAELLAELFLGDRERQRKVEEILAWLHASQVDDAEDDFDALLSVEPTEDVQLSEIEALVEVAQEAAPAPEPTDDTTEAPKKEEAPKKADAKKARKPRTRRKKKTAAKEAEPSPEPEQPREEAAEVAEEAAEEAPVKPKPKTKRNVRRKKKPAAEERAAEEPVTAEGGEEG
jgi:hypothetical protein